MSREGDWMCSSCRQLNFKRRESCYNCQFPKFGGGTDVSILPGDWYCNVINCGAHNYASRTSCHKCGSAKNDNYCGYDGSHLPGWKPGDWICTRLGCGIHNYASRMECYKCRSPRDYGGAV